MLLSFFFYIFGAELSTVSYKHNNNINLLIHIYVSICFCNSNCTAHCINDGL